MKVVLKIVLIIVISLRLTYIHSQENQSIDSLFKLLNDEAYDSTQLNINRTIAEYYLNVNLNKAIDYFENQNTGRKTKQ